MSVFHSIPWLAPLLLALPGLCSASDWTVSPWETPAPPGSRYPDLISDSIRGAHLSWIEPSGDGHRLMHWHVPGGDARADAPRELVSGDNWFVNWADAPRIGRVEEGDLAASWPQRNGEGTYAYSVQLGRWTAEGLRAQWQAHDDDSATEHGFVSLLGWTSETLFATWLDGRATSGDHSDGHGSGGAMSLRAAVFDKRGKPAQQWLLDDRTCDCCQTDAAMTTDGVVLVYRDRSETELRDIAIVRWLGERWSEPSLVHADGWIMPGCPVNGPAVDARGRQLAVAWFTMAQERARVQLAWSADSGMTFAEPVLIDEGEAVDGRVDVALAADGSTFVSWIRNEDGGAGLWLARFDASGKPAQRLRVAGLPAGRGSGFPRLLVHRDHALLAWTGVEQGTPRVMAARVDFRN